MGQSADGLEVPLAQGGLQGREFLTAVLQVLGDQVREIGIDDPNDDRLRAYRRVIHGVHPLPLKRGTPEKANKE
jgi:hypothetical protein